MLKHMKKLSLRRILALAMAILTGLSIMPMNGLMVKAETINKVATFYVYDVSTNTAVKSATVTVKDGESVIKIVQTNDNGAATASWEADSESSLTYTYTVQQEQYFPANGTVKFNEENGIALTAREKGQITGIVTDDEGQPLENVSVTAMGDGNPVTAITNTNGEYTINDIYTDATYEVTASLTGYASESYSVSTPHIQNFAIRKVVDDSCEPVNEQLLTYGESINVSELGVVFASESSITYAVKEDSTSLITYDEETGNITAISGMGTASITATSAGSKYYNASSVDCKIKLEKAEQAALNFKNSPPSSISWREKYQNKAEQQSEVSSGKAVTYSVSTETTTGEEIASIDSDGTVSFTKPGTVTVTATVDGDDNYNSVTASYVLTASKANLELKFKDSNPSAVNYYKGITFDNKALFSDETEPLEGTIVYSCDNSDIADIDTNTGRLTIKKAGTIVVTAKIENNAYYEDKTKTYSLTVSLGTQDDLDFEKGHGDRTIQYGAPFSNSVIFPDGCDYSPNVTYSSSNSNIATVDENGSITTKATGEVTISAQNAADEKYNASPELQYKLKIVKATQKVTFGIPDGSVPVITIDDANYNNEFTNVASTTIDNGAQIATTIKYSSSDDSIATVDSDGKVTIYKAETVTITATAKGKEAADKAVLEEASASYTLTINKAQQTIDFTKGKTPAITFEEGTVYSNSATSDIPESEENNTLTYSVDDGAEYIIDDTFNPSTGEFKIKGATPDGTYIVIKAEFSGNDRYERASATYSLKVKKADQTISFQHDEQVALFTGESAPSGGWLTASSPISENNGTGAITYSIKTDTQGILDSIDSDSGEVTVSPTHVAGTAVIQATKAADDNYNEATAEYTVCIKEWTLDDADPTESDWFTISGDQKNTSSNWYTGNVSIKAQDSRYQLSFSKDDTNADWMSELSDVVDNSSRDGDHTITFYVKQVASGKISNQMTVTIQKDSTAPSASIKAGELTAWDKFLTFLTFGMIENHTIDFTVTSSDATSGVDKVEYYIDDFDSDMEKPLAKEALDAISAENWTAYDETSISITEDGKAVVYAKVTDKAGNYVYASTNGVVFDSVAPSVTITPTSTATNGFYRKDVALQVQVNDQAPYSGIQKIEYWIEMDGVAKDGSSTHPISLYSYAEGNPKYSELVESYDSNTNNNNIAVSASQYNSDNVVVYVRATDNAGNVNNIGTSEKVYSAKYDLKICATQPTIAVSFENGSEIKASDGGVNYYSDSRKAKIVITGRKSTFATDLPQIAVTTRKYDSASNQYEETQNTDSYSISDWSVAGDQFTCYIDFIGDSNYSFTVDYTDKAGNAAVPYQADSFTVDKTAPTGTISIAENSWDKLLEKLTFHLFKNSSVAVTATSKDATSPIKSVQYCKKNVTHIISTSELENETWNDFRNFSISSDEVFTVYLKITDYAGNVAYICSDGYIVDTTTADIGIAVKAEPNGNGYYNSDVEFALSVVEKSDSAYSGISKVKYWVEKVTNGTAVRTQEETLYTYNKGLQAEYTDLLKTYNTTIKVNANTNSCDDVRLYIEATDNAGNVRRYSFDEAHDYYPLKLDSTKPVIDVSFDHNSPNKIVDGKGYFRGSRRATVTFTERTINFSEADALKGIKITALNKDNTVAKNEAGEAVSVTFGTWTHTFGQTPDEDKHTITIDFTEDANYTLDIAYTDKAGNKNSPLVFGDSVAPTSFAIDNTCPTGKVQIGENFWGSLVKKITFGLWSNADSILVSASAEDITSPTEIQRYITDKDTYIGDANLAGLDWKPYEEKEVYPDSQFVVYIKITDYAGNTTYINSDGQIIEQTNAVITLTPDNPITELGEGENKVGVYSGNVAVKITASEGVKNYSGIKEVKYWVTSDGVKTQGDILYPLTEADTINHPLQSELKRDFSDTITVDATKNNSSNVVVYAQVTDNAGNIAQKSIKLDIDCTKPAISVQYADEKTVNKIVNGRGYFAGKRTATITIKERENHFDAEAATEGITITAMDAQNRPVVGESAKWSSEQIRSKMTSEWTKTAKDTFVAVIEYDADANYSFDISYTDKANNTNDTVDYGESVTPTMFTVDTKGEVGKVSVGNSFWEEFISVLSFGLWHKETVTVDRSYRAVTSPIESCSYYIYHMPDAQKMQDSQYKGMTKDELNALSEADEGGNNGWIPFDHAFEMSPNDICAVYMKIVDYAGNISYFSTDGIILDDENPVYVSVDIPKANENGYYNSDVTIKVKVEEEGLYSGINKVEYWVVSGYDGNINETQRETLYSFAPSGNEKLSYDQLEHSVECSFDVIAELNNYDNVKVYVKAVDNAGNEYLYHSDKDHDYIPLNIDITAPKVKLSFDNNNGKTRINKKDKTEKVYFNKVRIATIEVTERTSSFNPEKAASRIRITGVDSKNEPVVNFGSEMICSWNAEGETAVAYGWHTQEGATPDEAVHTIKIAFQKDANYLLAFDYTDEAGNNIEQKDIDITNSVAPYQFTVDSLAPTGTVRVNNSFWNSLLDVITFGLWEKKSITFEAEPKDLTSPMDVFYMVSSSFVAQSKSSLDQLPDEGWNEYEDKITLSTDQVATIYFKVIDYAGNVFYMCSDGHVIDHVATEIKITLPKTKITNELDVGIYTNDVPVEIEVKDAEPYSGIKEVEYWVLNDGVETQRSYLYKYEYKRTNNENPNGGTLKIQEWNEKSKALKVIKNETGVLPLKADLCNSFKKKIIVDSKLNNSCNVVVYVGVTDNAGNYREKKVMLDIDSAAPEITVKYDDAASPLQNEVDGIGYFADKRVATIEIKERTSHFDATAATKGIVITAKDANGKDVEIDRKSMISKWTTKEGKKPNDAIHTAKITYSADANYTFGISYVDKAELKNEDVKTGSSKTPYQFTVDTKAPTGTISVSSFGTWSKLLNKITFGRWKQKSVTVSRTYDDETSPVKSVSYYKTSRKTAMSKKQLDSVTDWKDFKKSFKVSSDEIFTVYMKLVDCAGNTSYISTDGIIIDSTTVNVESVSPEVSIAFTAQKDSLYSQNVPISVKVVDPEKGTTNAYAGIKEITYEVFNMGVSTQSGVLYSFDKKKPVGDELVQIWEKENAFEVDASLNNSNDVVIVVSATDNAGNEGSKEAKICIDTSAPEISIEYNNNEGDTNFADAVTDAYFNQTRTATIEIRERNFSPELVEISITNTEGIIPTVSEWTTINGTGNGDNSVNRATLTYEADGDYEFAIICKDLVGNEAANPDYGNSLAPTKFTIDKTLPTINVSYDNNDSLNENYYKDARIATISITEHNFEESRVSVNVTASDNGRNIASPTISGWTTNGDVHTATIAYTDDAFYNFDIAYTDKAGNIMEEFATQSFYVDTTAPIVTITDIVNESANNSSGNIGFTISATDTNFDVFEPQIYAVLKGDDSFEQVKVDVGSFENITNGKSYTVENLDSDGIYRIECQVIDKAGNAFAEVNLIDENGGKYTEAIGDETELVSFSVNREGSVFELDEETGDVVQSYYVQNIGNAISIVEVNANELISHSVSVNGKEITEGTDYRISVEGGDGKWWKYTYILNKDLFAEEGEYVVVASSTDAANNNAFSDVKSANVSFVIDRTPPVVSISGLTEGGRYQTESQKVTLIPSDDGGMLQSLVAMLVDDNGKTLETLLSLEGSELDDALIENGGILSFDIGEGLYQNVRIICTDNSFDENGLANTYDETIKNVSVTASSVMIFWANKPLRNAVIGGGAVAVSGAVVVPLAIGKKRILVSLIKNLAKLFKFR